MKANRLNMFLKLYQKELQELKTEILLTVFAVVAASIAVYISGPQIRWTTLLFVMVAGLAGLLPVISTGGIFTKEFNHNTIYLVMSLPVRGGMILGSKLAAVVSQYLIGTLTVMISGTILSYALFAEEIAVIIREINGIPWNIGLALYFVTIVFAIYLVSLIFFSQIIAKLVNKFNYIVTFGTLFGLLWLTNKVAMSLIGSMNYAQVANLPPVQPIIYTALIYLGVAIVIFFASVLIYNRRIEL